MISILERENFISDIEIQCRCDSEGYVFVRGSCEKHCDEKRQEISLKEIFSLKEKLETLMNKFDNLVYSLQLQEEKNGRYSKR